jgi:hypothetical protein
MTDLHAPAPKSRTRDIVAMIAKLASQPSTWRGAIMFASGLGIAFEPTLTAHISAVGMALAGLVGMLVDDAPKAE